MQNSQYQFTPADLHHWADKGLVTDQQVTSIEAFVEAFGTVSEQGGHGPEQRKGFNIISIAYYFGGFMVLLAYTIFMGTQWDSISYGGQVAVSAATIGGLWGIGAYLKKLEFKMAGNLLIFAGTGIVPLVVYSAQQLLGFWPDDFYYTDFYDYAAKTWVPMELISIGVAAIVLWRTRFPLVTLLISFWLWFLSMDLIRLIYQKSSWSWSDEEQIVSTVFGLSMLAVGYAVQRVYKKEFSFWLYLFGHIIVLCHLSALTLNNEGFLGLVFIAVYIGFIVASVQLQSRVFLVFGALGSYSYVCYLAFNVFDGALGFVFSLAFCGLLLVLGAVGYQKYLRPLLSPV